MEEEEAEAAAGPLGQTDRQKEFIVRPQPQPHPHRHVHKEGLREIGNTASPSFSGGSGWEGGSALLPCPAPPSRACTRRRCEGVGMAAPLWAAAGQVYLVRRRRHRRRRRTGGWGGEADFTECVLKICLLDSNNPRSSRKKVGSPASSQPRVLSDLPPSHTTQGKGWDLLPPNKAFTNKHGYVLLSHLGEIESIIMAFHRKGAESLPYNFAERRSQGVPHSAS